MFIYLLTSLHLSVHIVASSSLLGENCLDAPTLILKVETQTVQQWKPCLAGKFLLKPFRCKLCINSKLQTFWATHTFKLLSNCGIILAVEHIQKQIMMSQYVYMCVYDRQQLKQHFKHSPALLCFWSSSPTGNPIAEDAAYLMYCEGGTCSRTIIVPEGHFHCFSEVNALWL